MKQYELTVITPGSDELKVATSAGEEIKKILESAQAKVKKTHAWGRRPLAYPINKQTHGYYTTFEYEADASSNLPLERELRLHAPAIRFLITEAFANPVALVLETVEKTDDSLTRTAEEELRRSGAAKKATTKKKATKLADSADEDTRQQQVDEALSKILEDEETENK